MKTLFLIIIFTFSASQVITQDFTSVKKLIQNKNYNEAKKELEKLSSSYSSNAELHYYLGHSLMGLKDYENASEEYEKAIKINWNDADYHFALGQAYGADAQSSSIFTKMRLAPKIKECFLNAVKVNPSHIKGRLGLIGFYRQAPGIMGGGMDKAYEEVKKLISIDELRGRYELARLYVADKNITKADEEFKFLESKIGKNVEYGTFYNEYGYYLLKNSKATEAIQKFKKQIEMFPNDPNSFDSLGDGYLAAGNKKEAKEQFKKALEIDPSFEPSKKKLKELSE